MKFCSRYSAMEILHRWEATGDSVDLIMEQHLQKTRTIDPRDRGLLNNLVHGVIRWRGYLDWLISEFSARPDRKIKNQARQALRIGLYQLIFMDRIPPSAAINETIEALKKARQPAWLTGFVNGLLRNAARRPELPRPEQADTDIPEAARLSHPEWLIKRWQKRYGDKIAEQICRANNTLPILGVRVNTSVITANDFLKKLQAAEIAGQPGFFCPEAVLLPDFQGPVTDIPGYAEGFFQVQDEAAQLISYLLGPFEPGGSYLDGCAGLGGKTSHLAQMLPEKGRLFAVEPNTLRFARLTENLERLQLTSRVDLVQGKLENLRNQTFDGVLIDAPCSGLGVIRRHADIRWNRSAEDLGRYQERQLAILATAAELVKPDGILVYATCSMEPEEDDAVIKNFLTGHPDFSISNCKKYLPPPADGLVDEHGFLRTIPGRDNLDGFFAARFKKCY